ncbi:MAG: MT-A70 family methyltransferase [Candidatus Hodarchaeota archaeon]
MVRTEKDFAGGCPRSNENPPLPQKKYKTIYADPPWNEMGGGKICRGAQAHYNLMKTEEIMALPIKSIAEDNCHLYLWTTNNFLPDALRVINAWGFVYKTMITWPKHKIGLGQYFRGMTEHCLFAVRGCLPYKIKDGKRCQGRTLIETSPLFENRREHSQKPEEMRQMIEIVSYPPYIELFARGKILGWDVWGKEAAQGVMI